MNKREFLTSLKKGLRALSADEANERITFYSEMIDDLKEEGLTEEEAVERIGSVGEIVTQTLSDDVAPKKKSKRRLSVIEIILLVLGSPIWVSLLIAAVSVIFTLYAVLWSLVVSAWAVFASLCVCASAGILKLVTECIGGNVAGGLAMLGLGLCASGLAIFGFYGCKAATRQSVWLTKKGILLLASFFGKRGETK